MSRNRNAPGRGSGRRSPVSLAARRLAPAWGPPAWVLALLLGAAPVEAQLEVLLRGLEPAKPRPGRCGRYRFEALEPGGPRKLEFLACVERIAPGADGSVFLRLTSGDSLDAHVELAPGLFERNGGPLLDQIRSVVEIARGDTTRLGREDWANLPGLDPTPPLPGARDTLLAPRDLPVGSRVLRSRGRRIHEESRQVRPLGEVQMTQSVARDIETWTAEEAPLFGLVHSTASIQSERLLSAPVPGVPQTGRREWRYELRLLEIVAAGSEPRSRSR